MNVNICTLSVLSFIITAWSSAQTTNTRFTIETAGDPSSPTAVYIAQDGQPYFAKGVAYSPIPIGGSFHYAPQIGDWFYGPWQIIPETDFAMMKSYGINNIRTYAFWYWGTTNNLNQMRTLTQASPINATGSNEPFNQREKFFTAMETNDITAILGIALDGSNIFNGATDQVKLAYGNFYLQTAEKLAAEFGKEPSVMAFCLSNEQNQAPRNASAYVWSYYYEMAKRVRRGLGDNKKLITIAWQNDTNLYNGTHTVDLSDAALNSIPTDTQSPAIDLKAAGRELRENLIGWTGGNDYSAVPVEMIISTICDFWGLNIYAGMASCLDTYKANVFEKPYRKPLIVTEWGHSGTQNDPVGTIGPIQGNAGMTDKSAQGMADAATGINGDIESMNNQLAFFNGGTYFEWTDEWWKNDSYWQSIPQHQLDYLNAKIAAWKEGDPVPTYDLDANGKINFVDGNGNTIATGYPQYTFVWDGTHVADWPEEGWGLFSVSPNDRQPWDNPWNLKTNSPQKVDHRTPRTLLLNALMGTEGGAYAGKGYPWLEKNLKAFVHKEEVEGWHYVLANHWAYDNNEQEFVYLQPATGDTIYTYDDDTATWGTLANDLSNQWMYFTDSGWVFSQVEAWNYLQSQDGGPIYIIEQDGGGGPLTPLR